jgi:hypothetical protein
MRTFRCSSLAAAASWCRLHGQYTFPHPLLEPANWFHRDVPCTGLATLAAAAWSGVLAAVRRFFAGGQRSGRLDPASLGEGVRLRPSRRVAAKEAMAN